MTRRSAFAVLLLCAFALGCSESDTGPVRIVWGRHACDHCGMAISEARYAAELRLGPREVMRFDDFGCAVLWLESNGGLERATEFWVMDAEAEQWLDARAAFYRPSQRTPMAHGFAAIARREPGASDFDTARRAILAEQEKRSAHGRP